MSSPSHTAQHEYLSKRRDVTTSFGYGLSRRTQMALEAVERFAPAAGTLRAVDFGCADGAMLNALAQRLGARFEGGTGLDVFRSGVPDDDPVTRIVYRESNLFRDYPFPLEAGAFDIAIASAFIKHHPDPARFLSEVARCLGNGGIAVLMDPRPFVVKIGFRFSRFNPAYNPSLWSRNSVQSLLADHPTIGLTMLDYRRYWIAPTYSIYRLGVEKAMPSFLRNAIALHQCMVLVK